MSKWPLLMCPECSSPLQNFAVNLEQNMFMCIGERKRDQFRGHVSKDTYNELKECSYPFTESDIDVAFFLCQSHDTFKKAHEIADFLSHRRKAKYAPSLTIPDPPLILEKSCSYICESKPCPVSETEVSTEDFCVHI